MVCAQDDRKLKTIALLVDTPGYNQLMMLSKSAAEQLAEKTELAKHLEEREKTLQEENEEQVRKLQEQNKLASERERKLQERMEEQSRVTGTVSARESTSNRIGHDKIRAHYRRARK